VEEDDGDSNTLRGGDSGSSGEDAGNCEDISDSATILVYGDEAAELGGGGGTSFKVSDRLRGDV